MSFLTAGPSAGLRRQDGFLSKCGWAGARDHGASCGAHTGPGSLGGRRPNSHRGSGTSGLCTSGHCKLTTAPLKLLSLLLISRIEAHLLQSFLLERKTLENNFRAEIL